MECYILTIRWAAASNLIVSIYNTEFDVTCYIEFRLFKNQEIARQDTEFNAVVILSLNQHIASSTEQLQEIEDSIKELISQAQEIKDKIDLLLLFQQLELLLLAL